MIIGVDLDEVLAGVLPELIKYHNDKYNTNFEKEQFNSFDLWKIWNCTKEESLERVFDFYNSKYFRNIQPVEGSQEAIDILSKKHDLVVITSRASVVKDKSIEWLSNYFPDKFSKACFTSPWYEEESGYEKAQACKELKVKVHIDDNLSFARKCSENGTKVLLYNQPWNQLDKSDSLPENMKRVYSWNDIVEKIQGLEDEMYRMQ